MQKARWSTAVAAAALIALPVAAAAQSTPSTSQQNPPAQQQVDASAAKAHLVKARETLSQLTSMPEAAKLQGAARSQVSQVITDFNALITTQSEWRSAYAKIDADMTALLGPETTSDQPVGTSGSDALDPAIRAKLVEFRAHLKAFEKSAGGQPADAPPPSSSAAPPSAPSPATSHPAATGEPKPGAPNPASPASPVGTSGVSPSSPTASTDPADRERAERAVSGAKAAPNADAQKELDAISAILSGSKTGTLTEAETTQLKKHVENLRAQLIQK